MHAAIARFLDYLRVERNASDLTIKSYREDLTALAAHLTESHGRCLAPGDIRTLDLRGYVASLHEAGYARTTVARRLASRQLLSLWSKEGWTKPTWLPRQSAGCPHVAPLSFSEELAKLLEARRLPHRLARADAPCSKLSTRPACACAN